MEEFTGEGSHTVQYILQTAELWLERMSDLFLNPSIDQVDDYHIDTSTATHSFEFYSKNWNYLRLKAALHLIHQMCPVSK